MVNRTPPPVLLRSIITNSAATTRPSALKRSLRISDPPHPQARSRDRDPTTRPWEVVRSTRTSTAPKTRPSAFKHSIEISDPYRNRINRADPPYPETRARDPGTQPWDIKRSLATPSATTTQPPVLMRLAQV